MDDFQMATPGIDRTVTNQRSPTLSRHTVDQRWAGFSEREASRILDRIDPTLFSDESHLPGEEELLEDTDVDDY
jgi:hypothetical protein